MRGALVQLDDSLNNPTDKFGIDYRMIGIAIGASAITFLIGGIFFHTFLPGLFVLAGVLGLGRLTTWKDPNYGDLLILSVGLKAYYDPGK